MNVSVGGGEPASDLMLFERRLSARVNRSIGAPIATRYRRSSGARSAQRSRASCSRRAASSFASTAATSAADRFGPLAAERGVALAGCSSSSRSSPGTSADARALVRPAAIVRAVSDWYERSSRSSVAIAVRRVRARRGGPVGGQRVLARDRSSPAPWPSSDVRSAGVSTTRAAAQHLLDRLPAASAAAAAARRWSADRRTRSGSGRTGRAPRAARRSAIASSSSDSICRTSAWR